MTINTSIVLYWSSAWCSLPSRGSSFTLHFPPLQALWCSTNESSIVLQGDIHTQAVREASKKYVSEVNIYPSGGDAEQIAARVLGYDSVFKASRADYATFIELCRQVCWSTWNPPCVILPVIQKICCLLVTHKEHCKRKYIINTFRALWLWVEVEADS